MTLRSVLLSSFRIVVGPTGPGKSCLSVDRWGGLVLIVSLCRLHHQELDGARWREMWHNGTPDAHEYRTVLCCSQWLQILGRWLRPWPIVSGLCLDMGTKWKYTCTFSGPSAAHMRRRTCRTMYHSSLGGCCLPAGSISGDRADRSVTLRCTGPHGWGCCESSHHFPQCAIVLQLSLWLVSVHPLPELFYWEGAKWGQKNDVFDWTYILRRGYQLWWQRNRNLNRLPPAENVGPRRRFPCGLDTVIQDGR